MSWLNRVSNNMDTSEYMMMTGVDVTRSLSDCDSSSISEEDMVIIRKGPWTEDEDSVLLNYVALHGEGHWNSVARSSGLKRTGKSCRLRWLNYLRPNVRRGNITLQEQLLILDLHSRWGNRWSKIAEQLPGRTDNEIKNYWRTRVVKQARHLKCDVNSKQFRDTLRFVWIPQLMERIQIQSTTCGDGQNSSETCGGTQSNPLFIVSSNSDVQLQPQPQPQPPFLSHNHNLMDFDALDLWSDENIWFLQKHLADD